MKKLTILLTLCVLTLLAFANDGVYYAAGNQLIPITETDIQVKKEILTLNRVGDHLEVTVYYEFYNPVGEKDLLVGFEAPAAYPPQKQYMDVFPDQPHIRNFKVVMNGQHLSYEIAHVPGYLHNMDGTTHNQTDYYQNGKFNSWTKKQCMDSLAEIDYMGTLFYYVYHFKAHFKKGLNIVEHTYEYDLSFSVAEDFRFDYILTAANRWANKGIDDFTLNINLGDKESFTVKSTFFGRADEWRFTGKGRSSDVVLWDEPLASFRVKKGGISYHKTNFHPEGELRIMKPNKIIKSSIKKRRV